MTAKITYYSRESDKRISVEVEADGETSLLEAAESIHAHMGSSCGGVCACSTCHVYIREGDEHVSEAEEDEEDRLDMAFDVQAESRLGCQARVLSDGEILVEISDESIRAWYDEHPDARKDRDSAA